MSTNGIYPEAPHFTRQSRNPGVPITEPTPMHTDRTPSRAALLALAMLAAWAALVLPGCGVSEAQVAQALADEQHSALAQAQSDAAEDARQARIEATLATGQADLARIAATMAQGRPNNISPADWALAQRALGVAMGRE